MSSESDVEPPAKSDGMAGGDLDGTKPITDRDSKMVMLRGERGDEIQTVEIIEDFDNHNPIPDKFEIRQRLQTYFGAEIHLKPSTPDENQTYMLTAPGPDKFLYLWVANTNSDGFRIGWKKIAELKTSFSDDLPQYPICSDCGEPIKSLEHERLSIGGECEQLVD